jgi:hypothetical protein
MYATVVPHMVPREEEQLSVMMDTTRQTVVIHEDITFLRKLVIGWNSCASGAPGVNMKATFGTDTDEEDHSRVIADWIQMKPLGPRGTFTIAQKLKLQMKLSELIDTFEIFLQLGRLEPGTYSLPNYLRTIFPNGSYLRDSTSAVKLTVPQTETIEFTLTSEHLQLLRKMNAVGLVIDPKRPYGDMSYSNIDPKLHSEMVYALQALLLYGTVKLGLYGRNGDHRWKSL